MRDFVALLTMVVLTHGVRIGDLQYQNEWDAYKHEHKKAYETSKEELERYTIWKSHRELVLKHNSEADKGMHTYWLAINKYADLTNQEFVAIYNGYNASMKLQSQPKPSSVFVYNPSIQVPDKIVSSSNKPDQMKAIPI